jgi:hypothetical protein
MLNEADGYQEGGDVDGEAGGKVKDADALFSKLKRNVKADYNSKGPSQLAQKKRAKISRLMPANNSTTTTRRFCRTLNARSSFSTA